MVSGPDVVRPARGTRPANRRDLIVSAAADLFYRKGYQNIGMGEVAEAVAIGPSALYRHFRGKQSLLATVISGALRNLDDAIAAMGEPSRDIAAVLASSTLAHREVGVLWRREARHLSDEDRAEFRVEARRIGARLTEVIAHRRPELDTAQADLLAWCALAVADSVSFHSLSLPEPEFSALLTELIATVIGAAVPTLRQAGAPRAESAPLAASSRREAILTQAVQLFAERGFAGVGMDDIGAATGIAGPSVYNHFPGKTDILSAAIVRGDEWLRMGMHRALSQASDPREGLVLMLGSYSAFAFENPYLIQTLVSEVEYLPQAERQRARVSQRAYIGEWVHLLRGLHPDTDPLTARIRVQAAQIMVNDIASTPHLRGIPDIDTTVSAIGAGLLDPAHGVDA
ncbi:TetR/AcrR family transcriptional regulator [Nocardia tengchongensis]|uniref:TetR/AcrR family transcriptional regulator n=2 Tax=Nocardia tengchongensis TaxID=2055889 RepID=UPI0036C6BC94